MAADDRNGRAAKGFLSWVAPIAFFCALAFLSFVWGVASVTWKIFPHRQVQHVLSGIESWNKFQDKNQPLYLIGPAAGATSPDPVKMLVPATTDDLILVTGGFYFRMDLCPTFGCIAYLIDRTGKVYHTWEADPDKLFTDADYKKFTGERTRLNINIQGADIDRDGNLIVTLQGTNLFPYQVGIAKFGWSGGLDWVRIDNAHHWPRVGSDGRIYAPIAKIVRDDNTVAGTRQASDCKSGAVFQEGVEILAPDGTELHRYWMDDLVQKSEMQGLAYSVRNDCDPYHVNGIDLLNAAAAARMPGTEAGDLLISLRSSSSLIVVAPETGEIRHVLHGPMVAQHCPRVLVDGRLAVFDNLGATDTEKGTRIVALNPETGEGQTLFPILDDQPGADLDADQQGEVSFSADGRRMLVSETMGGRIFEVETATGRPLWMLTAISDMAPLARLLGGASDGPQFERIQTQGALFVKRADFDRWQAHI